MMRTRDLPPNSCQRSLAAAVGFMLTVATVASAQVAPEQTHTTVGAGAGMDGAVSPSGGFGTSIPLDLPSPRGSVPIPLAVSHTGSTRAGVAGLGWDVPISYVRRSTTAWRRKPWAYQTTSTMSHPIGSERVTVSLGGQVHLMRAVGSTWWPARGRSFMELRRSGNEWSLRTLDNHEYVFRPASSLGSVDDPELWLLAEVRDSIGGDRVDLRYDVPAVQGCRAGLALRSLAYTFDRAGTTPLYEIELVHEPFWREPLSLQDERRLPACATENGQAAYPFERVRDDGTVFERGQVLRSVRIKARNNLSRGSPAKVIRSYSLDYDRDPTTERPRLREVPRAGEEGFPGASTTLTVARYQYGTLAHEIGDQPTIRFGKPRLVARNYAPGADFAHELATNHVSATEENGVRTERTRARHLIRDLTGDGVPDLVYKVGSTWKLHRGRATEGGPQFGGVAMEWTQPAELFEQTSDRRTGSQRADRAAMITTQTWSQFVDWDGDGRLDVIDVHGGQDLQHWRVWLNRRALDGRIAWHPVQVDIEPLRAHLENTEVPFLSGKEHLAIDRARSWPRWDRATCTIQECMNDSCGSPAPCPDLEPIPGLPPVPSNYEHAWNVDTMTEWLLADTNGDSYPDFVSTSQPVRQHEDGFWRSLSPFPDPVCVEEPHGVNQPYGRTCRLRHQQWIDARTWQGLENGVTGDEYVMSTATRLVFHNRHGAFQGINGSPYPEHGHVEDAAPHGVAHWTTGTSAQHAMGGAPEPTPSLSWQTAGYADRTGEGMATVHTFAEYSASSPMAAFGTDRHRVCDGPDALFESRQIQGEVDLDGDGLVDIVSHDSVRFNLGVGYSPPRVIETPPQLPFELSLTRGTCGSLGWNISGLTDLDGDGKPELLRVIGTELWMATLEVGAGSTPADAQRLLAVDNGYGALTHVRYKNAKHDNLTRHDVPFPEIVVGETGTLVLDGSAPNLAPTYYAYGEAEMAYDPLAAAWVFPGYRRQVAMRGKPARPGESTIEALVTISDRDPMAPAGSIYVEHMSSGGLARVSEFSISTLPWPEFFLTWNGSPVHGRSEAKHGAIQLVDGQQGSPPVVPPEALECGDLDPLTGALAATGLCRAAGVAYQRQEQRWLGDAAPPSLQNVMSGSTVAGVDRYGRPTKLVGRGDLRRNDDDVCTEISYAAVAGAGKYVEETPFPSVIASVVLTDCGWGTPKGDLPGVPQVISAARFRYDGLPAGQVQVGRLTSRWVDRYGPSGYLDSHEVERFTYNDLGRVESTTTTRTQGTGTVATQATWFQYDEYGASLTQVGDQASDVAATLVTTWARSTWPSTGSQETDHAGVITLVDHDAHGRVVREVVNAEGVKTTRRRLSYVDTVPRRVTVETFPGTTATSAEDSASDRLRSQTVLDALGRTWFTQTELGADYGSQTLVSGLTRYDELGRAIYQAAPFAAGPSFFPTPTMTLPYGTTTVHDVRGRVIRQVTAPGMNPTASLTNVATDTFVRRAIYSFRDGAAHVASLGADENDPASPRYLARDEVWSTALGRQTRRARFTGNGDWLDRVDQRTDRLGRVTETRRFLIPALGAGVVVWTSTFDSLGNRLSLTEPGIATRYFSYDEQGNELETWWTDAAARRSVASQYDGFGRLTDRILTRHATGGTPTIEQHDRMIWDTHVGGDDQPTGRLEGRLSAVETSGVGAIYYGYDRHGRVASTTYRYTEHGKPVRETVEFAAGGRLHGLTLTTSQTTDEIAYGYDSAGRARQVVVNGELLFDAYGVSAKGQYLRVAYGNGVSEVFDYAADGREELLGWSAHTASGTYRSSNLAFDGAGRVVAESHETPTSLTRRAYDFDELGRVTRSAQMGGIAAGVEIYTHDPLGNLLTRVATTGAGDRTFTFDPADPDRLCRAAAPGSGGSDCQLTYDGAGNVLIDTTSPGVLMRRYLYDSANRITRAIRYTTIVSFDHGPAGRARTRVSNAPNARTIWHFGALIEERRHSSDGQIQLHRRVPGPLGIVASLRSDSDGNTDTIYTHGDARGSRFFTAGDGTVIQEATYSLFGQVTSDSGDVDGLGYTDDLWNGGDYLPEVGISILGARAYDPEHGRFTQRDPIMNARRAQTAHPYAFAFNDPVNLTDPSGMQPPGESPPLPPAQCLICEPLTFSGGGRSGGFDALPGSKGTRIQIAPDLLDLRVRQSPEYHAPSFGGLRRVGRWAWRNNVLNPAFRDAVIDGFIDAAVDTTRYSLELQVECGFNLLCVPARAGQDMVAGLSKIDVSSLHPKDAYAQACPDGNCGRATGAVLFGIATGGGGGPKAVAGAVDDLVRVGAGAGDDLGRTAKVMYHGTDVDSAVDLLRGADLDAALAASAKIDGPPGFFLATEADDAAYFASRRGRGAILEYRFSEAAMRELGGLSTTPLGRLGTYGSFIGSELAVPVEAFGTFNRLRRAGEITVHPTRM